VATKRPKGLGLGLEALLGPSVDAPTAAQAATDREPAELPLDALQPGRYQPRTAFDDASLAELAESIRAQGVMQPVLVRPLGDGRHEIIAGERRVRAARLAGLTTVPVLVRDVPDRAAAAMALIENIQREDLNPLDEARGLERLTGEFGLTHEAAAEAVGRSRSAASNLLRLLKLKEPVQAMLRAGALDMGHARALLVLDGAAQIQAAQEIVAKQLSVRDAERLAARHLAGAPDSLSRRRGGGADARARASVDPRNAAETKRLEAALADHLAAPVAVRLLPAKGGRQRGEVAIVFQSADELAGIVQRLGLVLD
jgi:ParB family chromosome partitioning protein